MDDGELAGQRVRACPNLITTLAPPRCAASISAIRATGLGVGGRSLDREQDRAEQVLGAARCGGRFDKVTYTHNSQVADVHGFTMADEYVPHAVAAVHMLQHQSTVDPARVFVLVHSMGGKVAPRVAAAEASVDGAAASPCDQRESFISDFEMAVGEMGMQAIRCVDSCYGPTNSPGDYDGL